MAGDLVVTDPASLWRATIKAMAGGSQVQQRALEHRVQEWLRAIDQSRASGAGFGKAGDIYNSARHDFDQQMAGRPPAGDWVDTASNVLAPRDSSIGGEPPEQAECFSQSQFVRTLLLDEPERCISQSRTDPPTTAMSTRHQLFMTLVFATILAPVPRAR